MTDMKRRGEGRGDRKERTTIRDSHYLFLQGERKDERKRRELHENTNTHEEQKEKLDDKRKEVHRKKRQGGLLSTSTSFSST